MLRSLKDMQNYAIHAVDGEIGHTDDFITDTEKRWDIRYMVVDTKNILPGKRVLVSPGWIDRVQWDKRKIFVGLQKDNITNSPEFDPTAPINRKYEDVRYDYYGRPHGIGQ